MSNMGNRELRAINLACGSNANVLLTGPTGSGKTRLARRIHEGSSRARGPFVAINLATLHEGVIESELFGHEKGAFTSADARRVGKLELANGGTVFLDEIGDLSPRLQARLLEVLQSGMITPVGGNREMKLDLRVIAATHHDLDAAVEGGAFRKDLFHRVRVIPIHLRSLVERSDEFDEILHECLREVCQTTGRSILGMSEGVAHSLESYDWPGNFRELRNVLEYAVLAANGREINIDDLPCWLSESRKVRAAAPMSISVAAVDKLGKCDLELALSYEAALQTFEKEYFSRLLNRFGWRITRAARVAGISKATLLRRIRALGLRTPLSLTGESADELFAGTEVADEILEQPA